MRQNLTQISALPMFGKHGIIKPSCDERETGQLYSEKCLRLLHLASYHGLEIDLLQFVKIYDCEEIHRIIEKSVLDLYEKKEILKQQQEDLDNDRFFSSPGRLSPYKPKQYNNGELRTRARWEMKRHLGFIKPGVISDDAIDLLAKELER